ncbi:MAG: hypothetical protein O2923_13015 [Verrucomicrobia bacterium]|nr:hypothetical protein [Verrucomicrobiota bacterium]MDA1088262.1 hypothetical protein [Verrucomicrobiota bacterium]
MAYHNLGAKSTIDSVLGMECGRGFVVNVGMHRGDKENIVEENAAMVREILGG